MKTNAWDAFDVYYHGYDKFGDEPERLVFLVGRDTRKRGCWVMFRCSIECFETGHWAKGADAMAWGSRLTRQRPVRWEKNSHKPEGSN